MLLFSKAADFPTNVLQPGLFYNYIYIYIYIYYIYIYIYIRISLFCAFSEIAFSRLTTFQVIFLLIGDV